MRAEVFFIGIIMIIVGPIITAFALASCLGTILTGHLFACVTDLAYVVIGGTFFVVGIIMSIIGLIIPDRPSNPAYPTTGPGFAAPSPGTPISCKKCGSSYTSDRLFCPSCGQRPS